MPAYMTASLWQTSLVFFTQIDSLNTFYAFSLLYGFGYAGVMTGLLATARELTAPERRASQMGVILSFGWLGHSLGGFQGGTFYDITGNYAVSYANAALAGVVNLAIVGTPVLDDPAAAPGRAGPGVTPRRGGGCRCWPSRLRVAGLLALLAAIALVAGRGCRCCGSDGWRERTVPTGALLRTEGAAHQSARCLCYTPAAEGLLPGVYHHG